ncbi:DUF6252 family protein [Flavobacterium sp. N3904]|uniref:DUF6252 family protein n=1 Tax=Flavobacterium sp. N3904 TaxID=2986835 RepID=UPI0022242A2E|nr:DUF6252 family protein [Flavobacterium sp. N3904]
MKKFFFIVTALFVLVSCEDQVKFNNPALQGLKDNEIWRATLITAVQSADGSLTIEAYLKNEILTLTTVSTNVQSYPLGVNLYNRAFFYQKGSAENTTFSTGIESGNGQIVITEFDTVNHTITGTFSFNAKNESEDPLAISNVNFRQGVFYKVPITNVTK